MKTAGRHWLLDRLTGFADRCALVHRDQSFSYVDLLARIDRWRGELERQGLEPGSVVAVRGDHAPDPCSLFLAITLHGGVVAALPADDGFREYLRGAHAHGMFDFLGPDPRCTLLSPGETPPMLAELAERQAPGLVVFTSGTTGRAKAALFDFDALVERYRTPRPASRTLAFLLLDHLGGIHTMLHTLAHGGTLVIQDERRPDAVARAIERHRVEVLPTTPTFLRMLLVSRACERHDLSSLRLVTFGTEPMPPTTLEALRRALPAVSFKQTYGVTEIGVLPTRSRASGSLWVEVGGVGCEARVVDHVLWVRSPLAMLGYLDAPSPFDADGWYNTRDAVEVDGPYIRIVGRATDIINVAGQKVYPTEVENVLLEIDNVGDATVWGQPNPVTGQVVAARVTVVEPEDPHALERRIYRICRDRLADYKIPAVIDVVEREPAGGRFKKVRPGATASPTAVKDGREDRWDSRWC